MFLYSIKLGLLAIPVNFVVMMIDVDVGVDVTEDSVMEASYNEKVRRRARSRRKDS